MSKGGRPRTLTKNGEDIVTMGISISVTVAAILDDMCKELQATRHHICSEIITAYAEQRDPVFKSKTSAAATKVLESKELLHEVLRRAGIDRSVVETVVGELPAPKRWKKRGRKTKTPPENPFG